MDALKELNKFTYVVEHNPNCPLHFLVRLVGKGQAMIDKKPYLPRETKDILGFGRTLKEAARRALVEKRAEK